MGSRETIDNAIEDLVQQLMDEEVGTDIDLSRIEKKLKVLKQM